MGKKRILAVDDEAGITRLLRMNLEQTGEYEVREVNQGSKALAAAKEFRPNLVLLDVMMPDMDGGDVASGLKADPALRDVPVVFLTAAVKKEELGASEGMIGGRMYIAKPLKIDGVLRVIKQFLG